MDGRRRPTPMLRSLAVGLLTMLFGGCGGAPEIPTAGAPDIVLITLDTLRADALGPYRAGRSLTPRIDAFASESVVFEEVITPIGTTIPAHASLFTSQYPRVHGVRWNGDSLAAQHETLAEVLSSVGYDTAAFVAMPLMLERGGLGQGFGTTIDVDTAPAAILEGSEVNRQAVAWLDRAPVERPIFLWVHYFEAHSPYSLGDYAKKEFGRIGYDGPLRNGASTELFYSLGTKIPWTERELAAVRVLYDGEVSRLDDRVGEVLDALGRRQGRRPRLIVLTADHGQSLGENGEVGHGFLLWQTVLRVPLVIGGDAVSSPGARVRARVSLVDIEPTILDAIGMESGDRMAGRSLWPVLSGGTVEERPLFAEVRTLANHKRYSPDDAQAVAVFDGASKLVWRPNGQRYYDLDRDPGETGGTETISGDRQLALALMAEHFAMQVESIEDRAELDEDTYRQLRALGYVD